MCGTECVRCATLSDREHVWCFFYSDRNLYPCQVLGFSSVEVVSWPFTVTVGDLSHAAFEALCIRQAMSSWGC